MLYFIINEEQEKTMQVYKTIRVEFYKITLGSAYLTNAVSKSWIWKNKINFWCEGWNNTVGGVTRGQSRHLGSQWKFLPQALFLLPGSPLLFLQAMLTPPSRALYWPRSAIVGLPIDLGFILLTSKIRSQDEVNCSYTFLVKFPFEK